MNCPNGFWCFQLKDFASVLILVATIAAIYWGPIKAVQVSRRNEEQRAQRRRQYEIFHSLMKTRRMALAHEHVMALNVIVIEFDGYHKIIEAFKRYVEHLALQLRQGDDLAVLSRERDDRFFDLMHEIGASLGFTLDKRDLERFSYVPQGWNDVDFELTQVRRLALELLSGHRPLNITQFATSPTLGKFPPPPASSAPPA